MTHWGIIADRETQILRDDGEGNPFAGMAESKRTFGNNYCGDSKWLKAEDSCISMMNEQSVLDGFKKDCVGKSECNFDLNAAGFIDKGKASSTDCSSDKVQIYMQIACEMTDEDMRNLQVLACAVLFICFVIAAIYYEMIEMRGDNGLVHTRKYDI